MPEDINRDRRRFLGTAEMGVAVAELAIIGTTAAQSGGSTLTAAAESKPGITNSFAPLKHIDAGPAPAPSAPTRHNR